MARANLHLKKEVIQTKTPNTNGKFRVKKKLIQIMAKEQQKQHDVYKRQMKSIKLINNGSKQKRN